MEELQKQMYDVSTKLYQQSAQASQANQSQAGENPGAGNSENVYNADYKEVDPDKK